MITNIFPCSGIFLQEGGAKARGSTPFLHVKPQRTASSVAAQKSLLGLSGGLNHESYVLSKFLSYMSGSLTSTGLLQNEKCVPFS